MAVIIKTQFYNYNYKIGILMCDALFKKYLKNIKK
jgi:oligoendopeptidase F